MADAVIPKFYNFPNVFVVSGLARETHSELLLVRRCTIHTLGAVAALGAWAGNHYAVAWGVVTITHRSWLARGVGANTWINNNLYVIIVAVWTSGAHWRICLLRFASHNLNVINNSSCVWYLFGKLLVWSVGFPVEVKIHWGDSTEYYGWNCCGVHWNLIIIKDRKWTFKTKKFTHYLIN